MVDLTEEGSSQRSEQRSSWSCLSWLEFRKFNEEDFNSWLLKAKYFVKVERSSRDSWVKIAVLHLEGKVIQLHQKGQGRLVNHLGWEEYTQCMRARFGAHAYNDPLSNLRNLKQVGPFKST